MPQDVLLGEEKSVCQCVTYFLKNILLFLTFFKKHFPQKTGFYSRAHHDMSRIATKKPPTFVAL